MKKKYFSIAMYIVAILLIFLYLICDVVLDFDLSEKGRLFLLCGSCLFLYCGGVLLSKIKSNNKPMKINLWIFFVLYIMLLVTLTLFDSMWGRNGFSFINWFSDEFTYFLKHSINLIPFKTIIEFAKEFNSMYDNRTILLNLFGNFIALMPMAFFLPLLFKKQNKFKNFFITVILIVLGIELVQLLTASGRFDVDDILLNVSGASLMYFILKIKDMNKLIKNIFLLEKNEISKKSLVIIIISITIVILSAYILVQFRSKLYNDNYDEYNKIQNPYLNIIDEAGNNCDSGSDLFYEDDLHKYYFTCQKSDKVYVIVNDEEKYLVKDFLQNEKYHYDINRMLKVLDNHHVSFVKSDKYDYMAFEIKVPIDSQGGYSSPAVEVEFDDEDILSTDYDRDNGYEATFNYQLYLLPKKIGTTIMNVSFRDNDDNLLETHKYSVQVDENLNVIYEEI